MEHCLEPDCMLRVVGWRCIEAKEGRFYFCEQHWPVTEDDMIRTLKITGVRA